MSNKIRYRIKGKTYYKLSEEKINPEDYSLVEGIWHMENTQGEQFRLLIGKGYRRYTLYTLDGSKAVLKTTSISKVSK